MSMPPAEDRPAATAPEDGSEQRAAQPVPNEVSTPRKSWPWNGAPYPAFPDATARTFRILPIAADLMPLEISETRHVRRVRRLVIFGVALFAALVLAWYGSAAYETTQAQNDLDKVQDTTRDLSRQQNKYSELVKTRAQSKQIADQLKAVLAKDLSWSALLTSLQGPAQLVNFKQFGRCVDVTNFDTTLGYLIVWPCKQAPNPLNVGWNQRYTVPTTGTGLGNITGQISTYDSTRTYKTYCLTTAEPGAASYFVTVKVCPLTTDKTTLWTVSYQEKTYGAGYVIEDYHGSCLSPTNLDDKSLPAGDVFKGSTTVSKLIVAPCDGSKLQKWNAPPNIEDPSPLKNVGEK